MNFASQSKLAEDVDREKRQRRPPVRAAWERLLMLTWPGGPGPLVYRFLPGIDWVILQISLVWGGAYSWRIFGVSILTWIAFVVIYGRVVGTRRTPRSILRFPENKHIIIFGFGLLVVYFSGILDKTPFKEAYIIFTNLLIVSKSWQELWTSIIYKGLATRMSTEMAHLKTFTYSETLDNGYRVQSQPHSCSVRLLILNPWIPFRQVSGYLIKFSLGTMPKYTAISYAQGDSLDKDHIIIVNGKQFPCTAGTYNALYRKSELLTSKYVWIDTVCTDQSHDVERCDQVQLMRYIYSRAAEVRCQITPTNPLADTESVGMLIRQFGWLQRDWEPSHQEIITFIRHNIEVFGEKQWTDLVDFFANPWFTRIWVVQEVVAGFFTEVYYDNRYINWYSMSYVAGILADKELLPLLRLSPNGLRAHRNAVHFFRVLRVREAHLTNPTHTGYLGHRDQDMEALFRVSLRPSIMPLSVLLHGFHALDAADKRDKVYALLGMVIDTDSLGTNIIKPHYTTSVRRVFIETAKYLVEKRSIFGVLSSAGIGLTEGGAGTLDLPSWVPDWAQSPICASLDSPRSNVPAYAAAREQPSNLAWGPDENSLVMRGCIIDKIVAIGGVSPVNMGDHDISGRASSLDEQMEELKSLKKWHGECFEIISRSKNASKMGELIESLWRAIVGDRTATERPAPKSMKGSYEKWLFVLTELPREADSKISPGLARKILEQLDDPVVVDWYEAMRTCSGGRRFMLTDTGHIGFAPPGARVGDEIILINGAMTPFVVRHPNGEPCEAGDVVLCRQPFLLVGECFVQGIMDGEGLNTIGGLVASNLTFV